MPQAHLEVTSGVVRVFRDGCEWGDPFTFAVAIVGDERVATLKALRADGVKPEDFAAIAECLLDAGFSEIRWSRHRSDGTVQEKRFSTTRPK